MNDFLLEDEAPAIPYKRTRPKTALTPKERNFARAYVLKHKCNATQAALEAFDITDNNPVTACVVGTEYLKKPFVAAEIARLQAAIEYSSEDAIQELDEARALSIKKGQPIPMIQATMGKARVKGLIVDKQETTLTEQKSRIDWTNTSPEQVYEQLLERLKLSSSGATVEIRQNTAKSGTSTTGLNASESQVEDKAQ